MNSENMLRNNLSVMTASEPPKNAQPNSDGELQDSSSEKFEKVVAATARKALALEENRRSTTQPDDVTTGREEATDKKTPRPINRHEHLTKVHELESSGQENLEVPSNDKFNSLLAVIPAKAPAGGGETPAANPSVMVSILTAETSASPTQTGFKAERVDPQVGSQIAPKSSEEISHQGNLKTAESTPVLQTSDRTTMGAGSTSRSQPEQVSALGNLIADQIRPAFRNTPTVSSDRSAEHIAITVHRREKHLPVTPLWRGASHEQLLVPQTAAETANEAQPRIPQPTITSKETQARNTSFAGSPLSNTELHLQMARPEVEPIMSEKGAEANGFAHQLSKRISRELPAPAPPAAPLKTLPVQPTFQPGGQIVRVLEIGLEPAHLGTLTVRLSLQGLDLSINLATETQSALDTLTTERSSIETALKSAGYSLDELKIHRADLDQTRSQSQDQNTRGESTSRNSSTEGGDRDAGTSAMHQEREYPEHSGGKQDKGLEDENSKRSQDIGRSVTRAVVV